MSILVSTTSRLALQIRHDSLADCRQLGPRTILNQKSKNYANNEREETKHAILLLPHASVVYRSMPEKRVKRLKLAIAAGVWTPEGQENSRMQSWLPPDVFEVAGIWSTLGHLLKAFI